ncbi:MAG: class II glutamine amidotransferase [Gemmatimonadota bacterium]|nr:class II glutamine amidotransferase [Gemmatimonadota bacterium]
MCRFTLYLGPPIRLSTLLLDPSHSLIRQSTHAREREEPLNGDGFGVGWYVPELTPEPAVFRSITPAWNNRNLTNLARVVTAPCILAHVRAATQVSGVNEANCHPFRYGPLLCMHNGDVGSFARVRRPLLQTVSDEAFGNVYGSTDSEHLFALVIDELGRRTGAAGADALADALAAAIWRVVDLVAEHGGGAPSYLNLALSDGRSAVVSRFSTDAEHGPESLYVFQGELYVPDRRRGAGPPPGNGSALAGPSVVVSSERLTEDPGWVEVPRNHLVVLDPDRAPVFRACARPPGREVARSA